MADLVSETLNDDIKKARHRSPNYPSIGLEKALERAQVIKSQAGRAAISVVTAYKLWGYKKGAGDQTVAALKSFGLIDVSGAKDKRQIRLTDSGLRILGNAPDKAHLLAIAALSPEIHQQIWDHYDGELPADWIIRDYLVWDLKFNETFVDNFIAQFRATADYAGLGFSDKVADEVLTAEPREEKPVNTATSEYPATAAIPAGHRDFPVYLTNRQRGVLHIPAEMSYKDYELLKQQIENHLAIILVTSVMNDETTE